MTSLRSAGEIAFGLLFAAGAVFNGAYTLRNGAEFYRSFSEDGWLASVRDLVEKVVVPHATVFTVGLIVFEAAAAVLILTRGDMVRPALIAGSVFALVAALASSAGGAVANLVLSGAMAALAMAH